MICKGSSKSMQDLEWEQRMWFLHIVWVWVWVSVCLASWCVCLYRQWNYFLLTIANSLTANDNLNKLVSPRRQQESPNTTLVFQELFATKKFPWWNKLWLKWQTIQNTSVQSKWLLPEQKPHSMKKHVPSLVFPGIGSTPKLSSQIYSSCVLRYGEGSSLILILKSVCNLFNGNVDWGWSIVEILFWVIHKTAQCWHSLLNCSFIFFILING
jgi:hypothetical protein